MTLIIINFSTDDITYNYNNLKKYINIISYKYTYVNLAMSSVLKLINKQE